MRRLQTLPTPLAWIIAQTGRTNTQCLSLSPSENYAGFPANPPDSLPVCSSRKLCNFHEQTLCCPVVRSAQKLSRDDQQANLPASVQFLSPATPSNRLPVPSRNCVVSAAKLPTADCQFPLRIAQFLLPMTKQPIASSLWELCSFGCQAPGQFLQKTVQLLPANPPCSPACSPRKLRKFCSQAPATYSF